MKTDFYATKSEALSYARSCVIAPHKCGAGWRVSTYHETGVYPAHWHPFRADTWGGAMSHYRVQVFRIAARMRHGRPEGDRLTQCMVDGGLTLREAIRDLL